MTRKIIVIIITALFLVMGFANFSVTANSPPNLKIEGPKRAEDNSVEDYTFSATDPDGDRVHYWINLDNLNTPTWEGPYPSGKKIKKEVWLFGERNFIITFKAKDDNGSKTIEKTLTVTLHKNRLVIHNALFNDFIKLFTKMLPILQYFPLRLTDIFM